MNEVKFYLLKHKKNTPKTKTPVVLAFNYSGNRLYCQVGLHLSEEEFDCKGRQRVRSRVSGSLEMNMFLDRLAKEVQDIYLKGLADGATINNEYILSRLSIKAKNSKEQSNKFFDEWENYITMKSDECSTRTLADSKTGRNHFKSFCEMEHMSPTFEGISLELLHRYRAYLLKIGQVDNTVSATFKRLRAFLNWAYRMGKTTNIIHREIRLKEHKGNVHFLTWDEVMKMYHFSELTQHERQVRDVFCFCCFTGVRFGDIKHLLKSNIKSMVIDGQAAHFLEIRESKTRNQNMIPLMGGSMEIINQYKALPGKQLLPELSNQVSNRYLKSIAKRAGINDEVTVDRFKANKNERKTYKKHMKISTHWGRKSFVTNCLQRKMLPTTIMSITGHKDFKSFSHYYSVQPGDKYQQIMECFPISDTK